MAILMLMGQYVFSKVPPIASESAVTATVDPTMINITALKKAPFIKEGVNTPFAIPLYPEEYLFVWYRPGCHPLIPPPDGFGIKVGTISENFSKITVTKKGNEYTLCNNVRGDQVAIISTFVELPR